jgi:hypothetical protein
MSTGVTSSGLVVVGAILAVVFLPDSVIAMSVHAYVRYVLRTEQVPDEETRCRKCGYILRSITEPRCPECGERI